VKLGKHTALGWLAAVTAAALAGVGAGGQGPILLADDTVIPRATVEWQRADGQRVRLHASLPYASPDERTTLGANLEAYVALGGARLERGAGHPDGAIVRLGIWKVDRERWLFEEIAHGSTVVLELRNVRFNQDVTPDNSTLHHRMKYKVDDVLACGLTIDQTEMFNTVSATDDMGGKILPTQLRHASLTGQSPEAGRAVAWVEPDGTVSIRAELPYRLFRHKGDPWALEVPGTFFEPYEFDIEVEVLPRDIAAAEGVERRQAPQPTAGTR
jgi:hypothetical protein